MHTFFGTINIPSTEAYILNNYRVPTFIMGIGSEHYCICDENILFYIKEFLFYLKIQMI